MAIKFAQIQAFLSKRYQLNAAEAAEQAKLTIEDYHRDYKKGFCDEAELLKYMEMLEKVGDEVIAAREKINQGENNE